MVLVKSKFSMRFGGVELMQWIDGVTNIDRNIGQNRTTSLLKVAHTNGEMMAVNELQVWAWVKSKKTK